MFYDTKLIIDGVEVAAGAEENAPAIFSMRLLNVACNSPLQLGAVTTDCLDVVIANPFKPSFDGSVVELWISAQESAELDAISEIVDLVGDETTDEVLDVTEATDNSDEEEGEALDADEEAEVADVMETETIDQYALLEGEELTDAIEDVVIEDSEWHKLGVYRVVNQTTTSNGVRLVAYDNLSRLAIPFNLEANKTLQSEYNRLVQTLAEEGITLEPRELPEREITQSVTCNCREALGYFAGLLGGFASCDENGVIDISSYVVSDAILIREELTSYSAASAGEMTVEGFVLKDKSGVEVASVGDGQSIAMVNPLVNEEDLAEIYEMYAGLRFGGAELSAKWTESLTAGSLVRVFTRDEYENYLKLANNEVITDDIKSMINSLGKVILISSQTITFGGQATTSIKSICNSEANKIMDYLTAPASQKIGAAADDAQNAQQSAESAQQAVSRELVASSYAEIDETTGSISLYGKNEEGDVVSQLDLKSTGIELSDGEEAKARMYSDSEIGGVFQSDQMISETFRMGRFAWVAQSNGHLTLKDMGEGAMILYE